MQKITLKSIENAFKEKSWWAAVFNLLPAKYITYYFANYTKIIPNQVTFWSLLFAIFSGIAFYYSYFIIGAILYQISYTLDIVDGALARVTNQASKLGAFLDVLTDWFKAPVLIMILFYKLNLYYLGEIIIFLYFLNCCANKYNDMLFYTQKKSITQEENVKQSIVGKYFSFMKEKKLVPLPAIVEIEAFLLFLFPIFKNIIFVYLAIFLLVFHFVLKVYIIIKKLK